MNNLSIKLVAVVAVAVQVQGKIMSTEEVLAKFDTNKDGVIN